MSDADVLFLLLSNFVFMIKKIPTTRRSFNSNSVQSSPKKSPLPHTQSASLWLQFPGSNYFASLARFRVLLGQTQDPPNGPTTKSRAPRSRSLFVLVRGAQLFMEVKMKHYTETFCISAVLCQQSVPLFIIWSSVPLVVALNVTVTLLALC